MKYTQDTDGNRREFIRVKARLHFCISVIEGQDPETDGYQLGDCFSTSSADISLGGICIPHGGKLNVGFEVVVATPENLTNMKCLTCEKAYLRKNGLTLEPILGRVVWTNQTKCGIAFKALSKKNENTLSKYIWSRHLSKVRESKEKIIRNRKF